MRARCKHRFSLRAGARGSALVFALVVLSLILVSAVSLSNATVSEQKTSRATNKSVAAFQVADTGAEAVLWEIYQPDPAHATLADLAGALDPAGDCDIGVISVTLPIGEYKVVFEDEDGFYIDCDATDWRDTTDGVKSIISQGMYAGTVRAIRIAINLNP